MIAANFARYMRMIKNAILNANECESWVATIKRFTVAHDARTMNTTMNNGAYSMKRAQTYCVLSNCR